MDYIKSTIKTKTIPKKRIRVYDILDKTIIGGEWDLSFQVKLKQTIAEPKKRYIVIASTGGRWFVPIPPKMWGPLKKAVDKMLKKHKLSEV